MVGLTYQEQERRRTALSLEQSALEDLREEARRKGVTDLDAIKLSPEKIASINAEASAYAVQADALRTVEERQQRVEAAAEEAYSSVKGGLVDAIKGTTSFGEALSQIASKLADLALNNAFDSIFAPKTGSSSGGIFGGIFTGLGKLLGFDDGGYTGTARYAGNVEML
jgi:hypothetical protein